MSIEAATDEQIVEAIEKLEADKISVGAFVVLDADRSRNYYIQFAFQGERLFCEAVSNQYLEPENQLSGGQSRTRTSVVSSRTIALALLELGAREESLVAGDVGRIREFETAISLLRHVAWPQRPDAIYLCQHANRSKLTLWRGAAEIAGGWKGWESAGLPVERDDRPAEP